MKAPKLTMADLVILSMLFDRPMHGYQLVAELERPEVRSWAGISRPQVYYSLNKLKRNRLVVQLKGSASLGPERQVFRPAASAKAIFVAAVDRQTWDDENPAKPSLLWAALAGQANASLVSKIVGRRREHLVERIARERESLAAISANDGPMAVLAQTLVSQTIAQYELELGWLPKLAAALERSGHG